MCLLITSDTGKLPDSDLVLSAWNQNPDGFGLVYADNGQLTVHKGLELSQLQSVLPDALDHPYMLHFRWATHGTVNTDNCHPFRVIRKQLYMAHNGILPIKIVNPQMSDTWHLAKHIQSEIDRTKGSGFLTDQT